MQLMCFKTSCCVLFLKTKIRERGFWGAKPPGLFHFNTDQKTEFCNPISQILIKLSENVVFGIQTILKKEPTQSDPSFSCNRYSKNGHIFHGSARVKSVFC